jgi:dolichol-phosphate mannosyltransferase
MSGFFMMRRGVFEDAMRQLSGHGFKILLDLLASSPRPVQLKELPYEFRQRRHGESKLDTMVAWEFGMLLADKLVGHLVPVRFALFAFIGLLGLGVHLLVLRSALGVPELSFAAAQGIATVVAMTSNFFLNNVFTYRDQRLKGWRLLRGLGSFYVICSVGAVGNVGIAAYIFAVDNVWWLAGIAGAVVGSVWNYAVSAVFTWRGK